MKRIEVITSSSVKSVRKPRHFTTGEAAGPKQRGFNKLKALVGVSHRFPGRGQAWEEIGRPRLAGESQHIWSSVVPGSSDTGASLTMCPGGYDSPGVNFTLLMR